MKILLIIDSLRTGGKEKQLIELLKGLVLRKKITVQLIVMSHNIDYREVYALGVKIHYLIRKTAKDPSIVFKLYEICRNFSPDIIHTWQSMTSVYAIAVAKFLKIRLLVGSIRNATPIKGFSKPWMISKITFLFSDAVVSNSYAGLEAYRAPRNKSFCIHNGFDFSRTRSLNMNEEAKRKFGINSMKIVGMVGSFTDKKDYKTYFEAAEIILSMKDDVTFLAVGDGKNRIELEEKVVLQRDNKIKFLGKRVNVENIISIFDVGVLATNSRVHEEGIPNVVMEYMACGKPVVATAGGGISELVVEDKTGFLIGPHSPGEMADKIMFLLDNKEIADMMGKAGQERIMNEFTVERMVSSYYSLYKRLLLR